jgi:hypothetical protein
MSMKLVTLPLLATTLCVLLVACGLDDDSPAARASSDRSETAADGVGETNNGRSSSDVGTVEELAEAFGMWWREELDALVANNRDSDRPSANVDSFDLSLLAGLPLEERRRIRSLAIGGTEFVNQDDLDFGLLPELLTVGISSNNLMSIRGLGETSVVRVSLIDVPLSDITPISGLEQVEYLWIRSTEPIERLPDLSRLTEMYRLAIQANPLRSLDGIETLSRPVGLVLGLVEDVSALEKVNPTDLPIAMDSRHQQAQPEIVERIRGMGFEVKESFQ